MNFLDELIEPIQTLIQGNKDKGKSTVEKHDKAQTSQVGDQVLIFKHVLRPVGKQAFNALYIGPATVVQEVHKPPYMVSILNTRIQLQVNSEYLRKFTKVVDTAHALQAVLETHHAAINRIQAKKRRRLTEIAADE